MKLLSSLTLLWILSSTASPNNVSTISSTPSTSKTAPTTTETATSSPMTSPDNMNTGTSDTTDPGSTPAPTVPSTTQTRLTTFGTSPATTGLQCSSCSGTPCSTTNNVTCSSETMCISAFAQYRPVIPTGPIFQGCASSSLCPTTGNHTFSANIGALTAQVSVHCCNAHKCNSQTLSPQTIAEPNGRQCLGCQQISCSDQVPVNCRGNEDRCFNATGNSELGTFAVSGCISENACGAAAGELLSLYDLGQFSSGPTCCQGDMCNAFGRSTATPSTITSITRNTTQPLLSSSTTTVTPPELNAYLGLQVRLTSSQGISNATITEALEKFFKNGILNGTVHQVIVRKIRRVAVKAP